MAGRRAKIITAQTQRRLLHHARRRPRSERTTAIVMLSLPAGLRACEIARLDGSMVLDAQGGRLVDVDRGSDRHEAARKGVRGH